MLIFCEKLPFSWSFHPKILLLRDYASALVGKYSRTLYSKIYAPFVEYTPVPPVVGIIAKKVQNRVPTGPLLDPEFWIFSGHKNHNFSGF